MRFDLSLLLLSLSALSQANSNGSTPLSCKELLIPVTVSANNFALPPSLTLPNITLPYLQSLGTNPNASVSGTYTIGARYCEPIVSVPSRRNMLQVLVHGISYTRDYWSGLAAPGTLVGQDQYSWILYAAQRGYPTLSVDRLCNGLSSHPDGVAACQIPLEAETIHALIVKARAGSLPGPSPQRQFNEIILAGHSYGSMVSDYLAVKYPGDMNALLLTGFSFNISNGIPGAFDVDDEPAAIAYPTRFGNLPPSYLAATNESGFEHDFFYGAYVKSFADFNFENTGTTAVGELASLFLGQLAAPSYRGVLYNVNGNEDALFCQASAASSALGAEGNCSAGFSQAIGSYFPAAKSFSYSDTASTGHCLSLHLTAQQSYRAVFGYLTQQGF